jgi:hypothetical protein
MANLLESLLSTKVERTDDRRLTVTKRLFPNRPRELFDMFAVMGVTASTEGLLRGIEMKLAEPRAATFTVLARWPTSEEVAEFATPYRAQPHLRRMIKSLEFRQNLAARILMVFPERRRLLFVRLPRCAGETVMQALEAHHPVLPLDTADDRFRDSDELARTLGRILGRFDITSTIAVALPALAAFTTPGTGDGLLRWHSAEPVARPTDTVFCVLRPPRDLALSEVNALLTELRAAPQAAMLPASLREKIGPLPSGNDIAGWRGVGRKLLGEVISVNPVCRALGDGTAARALENCARLPIQLVGLARYGEWARVALGPMEEQGRIAAEPILRRDDLTPRDRELLDGCIAEDDIFYRRFEAKLTANVLPAILGPAL